MKEQYYKIFDQRGRLALVTPTQIRVNEWLREQGFITEDINVDALPVDALPVDASRWVPNGWRVTKVLI
jgi:hypothetical protein